MEAEKTRAALRGAIDTVCQNREAYVVNPQKDFVRRRKLPMKTTINYVITQGSGSTRNELGDFFGNQEDPPCEAALSRQRAKLKPKAFEDVFHEFNRRLPAPSDAKYRFFGIDGCKMAFESDERHAGAEYEVRNGASDAKPTHMLNVDASYDLRDRTCDDAVIQPYAKMDEPGAACALMDRYRPRNGGIPVWILDRGYESYNVMAHAGENGAMFLIRAKDAGSSGIVAGLGLPEEGEWDTDVRLTLSFSRSRKARPATGFFRTLKAGTRFDYLEAGTTQAYTIDLRVVRLRLDDGHHEVLLTNLPRDGFPPERLKEAYAMRWNEESSFRDLKYTIGVVHFHSPRPQLVEQEIWAALTAYNATERMAQAAAASRRSREPAGHPERVYRANFSRCAHCCRLFFQCFSTQSAECVMRRIEREMVPVRPGRREPRNMGTRRRGASSFLYRAA